MKLFEYEGKSILKRNGISIPRGEVVTTPDKALQVFRGLGGRAVLKAQITKGRRGKAGLIRIVTTARDCWDAFLDLADSQLNGEQVVGVLVEEVVDWVAELYLAVTVDDVSGVPLVVVSRHGGVDVEEILLSSPTGVIREHVNPTRGLARHDAVRIGKRLGLSGRKLVRFAETAVKVYQSFTTADATLLEINPLFLTKDDNFVAGDAKVEVDDNARFRQHGIVTMPRDGGEMDPLEREARAKGITFVTLPGNVAVLSIGAGITMALLDMIHYYGMKPANFCDAMGGSGPDVIATVADLVIRRANEDDDVKAVFFNGIVTATPLESVVNGIVEAFTQRPCSKPVVGSLRASDAAVLRMSVQEGVGKLEGIGFRMFPEVRDALEYLATLVREARV